jgi:phage recombination protein Bet
MSSNELRRVTGEVVHGGSALAITAEQAEFTPQQVAALQQLGVENATEGDLRVFFHQAQRTGLDPFAKQLYLIGRTAKRKDNRGQWHETTAYTIQTGIDGYRLVARRAADARRETLGYLDTLWCGSDGRWTDVWLADEFPAAAKVTVIRNGSPFPAVALWREYVQTTKDYQSGEIVPNKMWARMGANQLAKCAEALALRKAFPQDLSGIYTTDEMGQADNPGPARSQQDKPPTIQEAIREAAEQEPMPVSQDASDGPYGHGDAHLMAEHNRISQETDLGGITAQQSKKLHALIRENKLGREEGLAYFHAVIGREVESSKDLTKAEAHKIIDALGLYESGVDPGTGEVVDAAIVDSEYAAELRNAAAASWGDK